MEESEDSSGSVETGRWRRPSKGKVVSGVCLLLASKLGGSARRFRFAFGLAALFGAALAVAFAVFDHSLFEGGASNALRYSMAGLGALLFFAYPLLALFLPEDGAERRWDFGSAVGAILLLVLMGQAVGFLLGPYVDAARGRGELALGAKDAVLILFFLCSASFVYLQRRAVVRFFRSMYVGTSLVILSTTAVAIGVMIPQIDGFEDPDKRVSLEREYQDYLTFKESGYQKLPFQMEDGHEQYQAFRWAEGYFLYHCLHLYGIGMPNADLPPRISGGLEQFGAKYGREEEKNRRKSMVAMFTGQEKIGEIGAFIHANEDTFWRAFEVSTLLQLNRTYKSSWFASLLWLLGTAVFLSAYKGWKFRTDRLPKAFVGGLVAVGFIVFLKVTTALTIPWAPDLMILLAGTMGVALVLGPGVPASAVKLQKLGFFVVHNGLLFLLLGGATSKLFTERGILQLDLREQRPQDTYYRFFDSSRKSRLPFGVRLDYFGRRDWLALQVDFPEEELSSRPPRYTLWEGKQIALDYVEDADGELRPDLEIEVLGLFDRADVGLVKVKEAAVPSDRPLPLAELVVAGGEGDGRTLLLPMTGSSAQFDGEVLRDPDNGWRLAGAFGPDPESHFPQTSDGPAPLGRVEVSVVGEGDGQAVVVPVRLGETVEIEGGYRLRFHDASSDFRTDEDNEVESSHPAPMAEQQLKFPALWLDVIPPDDGEVERRVIFEAFDDVQFGRQDQHYHSDVVLRFRLDRWNSPGPPRYLVHWGDGIEPQLISETGERFPIQPGSRLPLAAGRSVEVQQLLADSDFASNLTFHERTEAGDGWDADFYSQSPRGAALQVTRHRGTPEEWTERVELATSPQSNAYVWFSSDREVVLQFLENSEMLPFEWRSVLSILEKDNAGNWFEVRLGSERAREIRVNDYFYYQGYRFFQTNANPQVPTYSGIGVVYDPGIPMVLVGMYTIIIGGTIAFLIRPAVKAKGA